MNIIKLVCLTIIIWCTMPLQSAPAGTIPAGTVIIVKTSTAIHSKDGAGRKFKAVLMQTYLANCVPCQLALWKERGVWKTHHPLTQHEVYQFGSSIDNHLEELEVENLRNSPAA